MEEAISKAHDDLTFKMGRPEYAPTTAEIQEQMDKTRLKSILLAYSVFQHKRNYGSLNRHEQKNIEDHVDTYINSLN